MQQKAKVCLQCIYS